MIPLRLSCVIDPAEHAMGRVWVEDLGRFEKALATMDCDTFGDFTMMQQKYLFGWPVQLVHQKGPGGIGYKLRCLRGTWPTILKSAPVVHLLGSRCWITHWAGPTSRLVEAK